MKEKKILTYLKKYWYIALIMIAVLIKHILTINLPLWIRDSMGADEYLMLSQAENLIKGNYLGPYTYLTLVKGIGFPCFLTIAFKLGISYLSLYNIFYTFACLIALLPIRKFVKSRGLQLVFFLVLLFCPATFDNNIQLLYRNMLTLPQSILLVSSLMMMYFSIEKEKRKLCFWSILFSLDFIFLWHTREDSIWALPVVIMGWVILFICLWLRKKREKMEKTFSND